MIYLKIFIEGCRDVGKGSDMVRKLRAGGLTTGSTSILPLDMACLDSVQAFATAVLQARPKLHLLINNGRLTIFRFVIQYLRYKFLSHFTFSTTKSVVKKSYVQLHFNLQSYTR